MLKFSFLSLARLLGGYDEPGPRVGGVESQNQKGGMMKMEKCVLESKLSLPLTVKQFEAALKRLGAEVFHPVRLDPVAIGSDGKVVAIWVEA